MSKTKKVLLGILVVFFIAFSFSYQCPFKAILHISCPGCGLTRSILSLLKGDFIASFHYSILGIPIFIFLIYSLVRIAYDLFKKQDTYVMKIYHFTQKHGILLIFILLINMIINNIRGI